MEKATAMHRVFAVHNAPASRAAVPGSGCAVVEATACPIVNPLIPTD